MVCEVSCICFLKKYNLPVLQEKWPKIFLMMELTFPFTPRQVTWLLVFSAINFVLLAFQSRLTFVNIKSFHKKYQENKSSLPKRRLLADCFLSKFSRGYKARCLGHGHAALEKWLNTPPSDHWRIEKTVCQQSELKHACLCIPYKIFLVYYPFSYQWHLHPLLCHPTIKFIHKQGDHPEPSLQWLEYIFPKKL